MKRSMTTTLATGIVRATPNGPIHPARTRFRWPSVERWAKWMIPGLISTGPGLSAAISKRAILPTPLPSCTVRSRPPFPFKTLWVYPKIIPIAQVLTKYFLEFFNRGHKPIFESAAGRTVHAFVGYDALESVPF